MYRPHPAEDIEPQSVTAAPAPGIPADTSRFDLRGSASRDEKAVAAGHKRHHDVPLVLVIDDGPDARELYRTCFELCGFAAAVAEDGRTGLASAVELVPDVILLDFSMPYMDGAAVLRTLQSDPRTRDIPVVMLTAAADLVPVWVRAACAAFLEKPCEPDHLMGVVGSLAHLSGPERGATRRRLLTAQVFAAR